MKPSFFVRFLPAFLVLPLVLGLLYTSATAAVTADAKYWDVAADKMIREENPPRLVAEGNVLLEKKEPLEAKSPKAGDVQKPAPAKTLTKIRADRVVYDITKGTMEASGHLIIVVNGDKLAADSGTIDMASSTGSFNNAVVITRNSDLHFEGQRIEKTGALTYHIEDGWVVTCKLEPGEVPPWSFASKDTKITDGGYALLKNATFRIKDFPVFYSPIMLLPAKHTRQTGFLFPSIYTSGRDGFGMEIPFFVNLSQSSDLTLYPRYMSNRGLMLGGEYRYVLDTESKGMLQAHFLNDDLSDPSNVSYYQDGSFTHTNSQRYWVRGKVDQDIGPWVIRLDVDVVSDRDYMREFNSGSTSFDVSQRNFLGVFGRGFTDKNNDYRTNTLGALRTWDNGTALLAEMSAVNDVSTNVYTPENPSLPWKLPSVTYSGVVPLAGTHSGPDFSWDANYTHFWRDVGVGAQRLDVMPTVTTGVPLSPYLESYVSAGVRDTAYSITDNDATEWKDIDSRNRFLYNLNAEVGTTMERDFAVSIGDVNNVTHLVRPYVAYGYTHIPDEKTLPQFDLVDTLEDQDTIYYGVNNFFTIDGKRNGKDFDRDYAYFKIKEGYSLLSEDSDTPLTPVQMETGWYPTDKTRIKYLTKVDVYGEGAYYHSLEGDYVSTRGDIFSLDYRYDEETDVNSIKGSVWYLLPYNLAAGYSLERNLKSDKTIDESFRIRYVQPCWSVELSTRYESGDQSVMITFRLANIGMPFGFDLGGN